MNAQTKQLLTAVVIVGGVVVVLDVYQTVKSGEQTVSNIITAPFQALSNLIQSVSNTASNMTNSLQTNASTDAAGFSAGASAGLSMSGF